MSTRSNRSPFRTRRALRLTAVAALAVAGLAGAAGLAPAPASAKPQPIGPKQHFEGLVNGVRDKAVIKTVCPGPVWEGRTGPIAAGQTLAVIRVAQGTGFTGPGQSAISAWVAQDSSTLFDFRYYGVPQRFPTTLRVPCDGPGQVVFSSCSLVDLCTTVPVPDLVDVEFVNIAD